MELSPKAPQGRAPPPPNPLWLSKPWGCSLGLIENLSSYPFCSPTLALAGIYLVPVPAGSSGVWDP